MSLEKGREKPFLFYCEKDMEIFSKPFILSLVNINNKVTKMKKILSLCLLLLSLSACSKTDEQNQNPGPKPEASAGIDSETVFSFDINTLKAGCDNESHIVCAINASIKCTINPTFAECAELKAYMPNFIFMEDESLDRPSELSYQIKKIRPLQDGTVEVITQSLCNGNWFGLCNGTIIYVMSFQNNDWKVKDLYALQEF